MKKLLSLLVIAPLLMLSCAAPKSLEYRGVENFRIQSFSLDKSTVVLDVQFYNPNTYSLDMKGGDVDIYINDQYLGKSAVNTTTLVPKQNTFLLPLSVTASLQGILQGAWSLLVNQEVNLKLAGSVKVGKGGVYINVPVNYVTKQKIQVR